MAVQVVGELAKKAREDHAPQACLSKHGGEYLAVQVDNDIDICPKRIKMQEKCPSDIFESQSLQQNFIIFVGSIRCFTC